MKYTAEECEKLEGKIVRYKNKWFHPFKFSALVVGCDPEIGITVVDNKNKNQNLYCLPGRSSNEWHDSLDECYERCFESTVEMIKTGFIDCEEVERIRFGNIHGAEDIGSMFNCPYGS